MSDVSDVGASIGLSGPGIHGPMKAPSPSPPGYEARGQSDAAHAALTSVIMIEVPVAQDETVQCQACGACCSYSAEWPRFSLESDADLERIPRAFVDDARGRMRCVGDCCAALVGEVGVATSCAIYAVRPQVCRACVPGDDACRIARDHFNL